MTASLLSHALRIALAILLDTATLVLWNIGSRSPLRLWADIRAGLRRPTVVVRGVVRFLTGAGALVLGAMVIAPLDAYGSFFAVGALIVAFVVEQLIGSDLQFRRRPER